MQMSDILDELTNHGFSDTSDPQKMRVIQDTIWEIEALEPWPWLVKSVGLTFDGISPTPLNIPGDFKQVKWVYDAVAGSTIWPERFDTIRGRFGNALTVVSPAFNYYFVGTQLRFYPIPPADATGVTIQLDYIASQPILTTTSVESAIYLPPRFHRAISLGALVKLYEMEDDPENGQVFEGRYQNKIATMKQDMAKQQWQRADQIYVVDEDDDWIEPWFP